jgi:prolyl 4-hydroxylase
MNGNNATTLISASWQQWISENLQRGITPTALLQIMLDNQFDRTQSQLTISALASKLNQPVSKPLAQSNYSYPEAKITDATHCLTIQGQTIQIVARVKKPIIILLDNFLSSIECEQLIALAQQKLKPSTTVDKVTGEFKIINDRRSEGSFFSLGETDLIKTLDQRIATLINWPIENGEGIQVLHYTVGGEYKEHYDYFDPNLAGSQSQIKYGGNRVATLIMYLNNAEQGGETVFPKIGFNIVPKKGAAVYFEYCNGSGQLDALTLHAGTPVKTGEKWIATKWLRERHYR